MTDATPVAKDPPSADKQAESAAAADANSTVIPPVQREKTVDNEPRNKGSTEDADTADAGATAPTTNAASKESRALSAAGLPIFCSCRKSKCIKLYCACYNAGIDCVDDCSCKKCKNNPKARREAIKAETEAKKVRERKMDLAAAAKEEATMLLFVSPGRLGLTLKMDKVLGGAAITEIDPACTFKGKLDGKSTFDFLSRLLQSVHSLTSHIKCSKSNVYLSQKWETVLLPLMESRLTK
jgi:hypothetical protein